MKKTILSCYCIIFCITLTPCLLFSQNKIALDFEAGASILTSKQVKGIYGPGVRFSAGPKFDFSSTGKFSLLVNAGFQWHFKEVEKVNSVTDHLRIWKLGAQGLYKLSSGKHPISAFASVDHNWCSNYYSAQTNFNPITNTSQVVTSEKYLKGNGISFGTGVAVAVNPIYFKLRFDYFRPLKSRSGDIESRGRPRRDCSAKLSIQFHINQPDSRIRLKTWQMKKYLVILTITTLASCGKKDRSLLNLLPVETTTILPQIR